MSFETITFPSLPAQTVFISFFQDVSQAVLETVKAQLVQGDEQYDFCFLNTNYIISREHLLNGIHKALVNYSTDNYKAKTLNTEIIFSMSPINNIMDSLKRFGVDSSGQGNLICIKVVDQETDFSALNSQLVKLLDCGANQNVPLTDQLLYDTVDIPKFKKVYKLKDAKLEDTQVNLTRLAIGACLLRGN